MSSLNQMELQDIRHTCGACSSFCTKLEYYKQITNDQNAIDIMNKLCQTCTSLKQDLCSKL